MRTGGQNSAISQTQPELIEERPGNNQPPHCLPKGGTSAQEHAHSRFGDWFQRKQAWKLVTEEALTRFKDDLANHRPPL